jgi:hypothetical protein
MYFRKINENHTSVNKMEWHYSAQQSVFSNFSSIFFWRLEEQNAGAGLE